MYDCCFCSFYSSYVEMFVQHIILHLLSSTGPEAQWTPKADCLYILKAGSGYTHNLFPP